MRHLIKISSLLLAHDFSRLLAMIKPYIGLFEGFNLLVLFCLLGKLGLQMTHNCCGKFPLFVCCTNCNEISVVRAFDSLWLLQVHEGGLKAAVHSNCLQCHGADPNLKLDMCNALKAAFQYLLD